MTSESSIWNKISSTSQQKIQTLAAVSIALVSIIGSIGFGFFKYSKYKQRSNNNKSKPTVRSHIKSEYQIPEEENNPANQVQFRQVNALVVPFKREVMRIEDINQHNPSGKQVDLIDDRTQDLINRLTHENHFVHNEYLPAKLSRNMFDTKAPKSPLTPNDTNSLSKLKLPANGNVELDNTKDHVHNNTIDNIYCNFSIKKVNGSDREINFSKKNDQSNDTDSQEDNETIINEPDTVKHTLEYCEKENIFESDYHQLSERRKSQRYSQRPPKLRLSKRHSYQPKIQRRLSISSNGRNSPKSPFAEFSKQRLSISQKLPVLLVDEDGENSDVYKQNQIDANRDTFLSGKEDLSNTDAVNSDVTEITTIDKQGKSSLDLSSTESLNFSLSQSLQNIQSNIILGDLEKNLEKHLCENVDDPGLLSATTRLFSAQWLVLYAAKEDENKNYEKCDELYNRALDFVTHAQDFSDDEMNAANLLKLDILQRLKEYEGMFGLFKASMRRFGKLSYEELLVLFTICPLIGKWKEMNLIGNAIVEMLQNPSAIEEFHNCSMNSDTYPYETNFIPDYYQLNLLAEEYCRNSYQNNDDEELQMIGPKKPKYEEFQILSYKLKFLSAKASTAAKTASLQKQFSPNTPNGVKEWKVYQCDENDSIIRLGQFLVFKLKSKSNGTYLYSIFDSEKIYATGYTDSIPQTQSENPKNSNTNQMTRQSETCHLSRLYRNNHNYESNPIQHFVGNYIVEQYCFNEITKKIDENSKIKIEFEMEMTIQQLDD